MNAENFKQRYLPFHDKMYRLAFRYTGSRENAEDMVQETYLKLWKKRDELPEIEKYRSIRDDLAQKCLLRFSSEKSRRYVGELPSRRLADSDTSSLFHYTVGD